MAVPNAEAPHLTERIWGALVGNQAPPPDAQRNFVPDQPRDVLVRGMEAIDAVREFNERVKEYDVEACVAFLKTRFYGQPMSPRYRSQCASVLTQELDRQNVRDVLRRANLIEEAVEIHIRERLTYEQRWNPDTIQKVNEFNEGVCGKAKVRSPYWYWKFDNISINSDLNSRTPWQESNSFKISHLIYPILAGSGVIIGLAALGHYVPKLLRHLISAPSATTGVSITIPSQNIQQVLPLLTGIVQDSPAAMIQQSSKAFTDTLESLLATNKSILDNNMLIQSTIQRVEDSIKQQSMSWMEVVISRLWSPPSPS